MSVDVTDANFDEVISKSEIPVLVKFWAPWCGPCRALAPAVEEIANEMEGKVLVANVNVDENPSTPTRYGIRAVPTFILFKKGELVEQLVGVVSKDALKELAGK